MLVEVTRRRTRRVKNSFHPLINESLSIDKRHRRVSKARVTASTSPQKLDRDVITRDVFVFLIFCIALRLSPMPESSAFFSLN